MFISLDIETTGLNKNRDQIIEFGAVKFDMDGHSESFQTLINPGVRIPEFITHLTNISDADVANAPKFQEVANKITAFIGDTPIIGHFISFDIDFLRAKGLKITNQQFDTSELARIFIPGLPSYSLEILSEILGLTHEEKHRALDDSIAAQELFFKILERVKTIDSKLFTEIKKICSRSSWAFAETLASIDQDPTLQKPKQTKAKTQEPPLTNEEKEIISIVENEKKSSLIESHKITSTLVNELAKASKKGTVILCPYNIFNNIEEEKTYPPKDHVSLNRLEEFKNREIFNTPQTTALIKILMWLETTKDHCVSNNLPLSPEEKSIFFHILQDPDNPTEKQKDPKVIISTYDYEPQEDTKNIIIVDGQKFKDHLHKKASIFINNRIASEPLQALLDAPEVKNKKQSEQDILLLKSKLETLFGITESIAEPNFSSYDYAPQFEVSYLETGTNNWQRIREIVQTLISESQNLKEVLNEKTAFYLKKWKEILKNLQQIYTNPTLETHLLFIQKTKDGEIGVRKIPKIIQENFAELTKKTKRFTILGRILDAQDNTTLFKKILGIHEDTKFHKPKTAHKSNIFLANDIPPNSQSIAQSVEFVKNFLKKEKGETLIIFNSIDKLEQAHLILAPKLKQEGITVLAQKGSGIGKILEMYKSSPGTSAIFLTPSRWEDMRESEQNITFKNLVIHQLPFDPPSNQFLQALSKNFEDPFSEFQIPNTIISLKEIIAKFLSPKSEKIVILDSRIIQKSYGRAIQKSLEEFGPTEEVSSSNLL